MSGKAHIFDLGTPAATGRLGGLLGGHHGRALLDDAGLDLGDLGDRAAETVGVVDVDRPRT